MVGRVPTKVTGQGGTIDIGDRITPSGTVGYGMKAGPEDPSIGIALESFDATKPQDDILVYLRAEPVARTKEATVESSHQTPTLLHWIAIGLIAPWFAIGVLGLQIRRRS